MTWQQILYDPFDTPIPRLTKFLDESVKKAEDNGWIDGVVIGSYSEGFIALLKSNEPGEKPYLCILRKESE